MRRVIFVSLFLLGSMAFPSKSFAAPNTWTAVGSIGFTDSRAFYTNLAFNPATDEPYITYANYGNSYKATVRKFNGSSWEIVGLDGFSAGEVANNVIAFNPATDKPYVAYMDGGYNEKVTVMKFDGSSWVSVGTTKFTAGKASSFDFAFNSATNEPYLVYANSDNSNKLTAMKFNGANWITVGSEGFSIAAGSPSIAFNPSTNQPFVAFDGNAKANVMKFNGSDWITVGSSEFSSGEISNIDLAFNPETNEPYVAFDDFSNSYNTTVMKFNGSGWVVVGRAGFTNCPHNSLFNSIAFNPETNEPYVAYNDYQNSGANVMKFNGSSWVAVGSSGFGGGDNARYINIVFNPETNEPYVAFMDYGNSYKATVMKYESEPAASDDNDSCGNDCRLYKHYKSVYKKAAKKNDYIKVKNLKKTNLAEFNRLKAVYMQYKKLNNKELSKLSLKIQNDFKLYKDYRGYKLYLKYKDKN